jgi:GPH family glycoside/pentoside/hexuronide:cation symporter
MPRQNCRYYRWVMPVNPIATRRVNPTHLGWAIGTLGVSALLNTYNVAALFFMVTVLQIDPLIAGALITGSKLYDAVTDPLMGAISDRTRSRWGRRRPWLLIGGIGCGVSFAVFFAITPGGEAIARYWTVGACLVLLSTAYTIFNVPYLAMPAEMVDDYHERSVMMSYRVFLISIGTFIGVAGAPALVAWFQDALGYAPSIAYRNMGMIIGSVIALSMVASFFGTRRAGFTEHVPPTTPFTQRLRLLFANRPFLLYLGIKLTGLFSLASIMATQFFFAVYILQYSVGVVAVFGTAQLAGQVLSIPAWLAMARRWGKTRILILSSFAMVVMAATWLLSGPGEPLWLYAGRGVLIGIASAGTLLGTQAILPDLMEYDFRRTGLRREGAFAGMASFIEKTAGALSGVVIGGFLSYMQFDKTLPAGEQPESALFGIMVCTALIPMAMYGIKLVLLWFYDLNAEKLKSTVRVTTG